MLHGDVEQSHDATDSLKAFKQALVGITERLYTDPRPRKFGLPGNGCSIAFDDLTDGCNSGASRVRMTSETRRCLLREDRLFVVGSAKVRQEHQGRRQIADFTIQEVASQHPSG